MTATEELRAAAEMIRTAAQAAGGKKWVADHHRRGTIVHPADSMRSLFGLAADGNRAAGTPHVTAAIGTYMAAVHPRVGELLAKWLDSAAEDAEQIGPDPNAVAVAREILAGATA